MKNNQSKLANTLKQVIFTDDGDIEFHETESFRKYTKQASQNELNIEECLEVCNSYMTEEYSDEAHDVKELKLVINAILEYQEEQKTKILDIIEIEKGFAIKITFAMKDLLKKSIPSAKWNAKEKMWQVGSRSLKKLEAFVEVAKTEFDIEEIENSQKEIQEKIDNSKAIQGHTFEFKDILKNKYNAIFKDKKWFVATDRFDEAQAEIDELNIKRKAKSIQSEEFTKTVANTKTELTKTLNLIEKIVKNYDENDNFEYKYQDDYFYNQFSHLEDDKKTTEILYTIWKTLNDYTTFADENDNPGVFFSDEFKEWLDVFNIPQNLTIDFFNNEVIDYNEQEFQTIKKLIENKDYSVISEDDISKELDNESYEPDFYFRSKKTSVMYSANTYMTVERYQNSSRVAKYNATRVIILNDDNFETIAKVWWNKLRVKTFEK